MVFSGWLCLWSVVGPRDR